MGFLDTKFEWAEFITDVLNWLRTDLLPEQVIVGFFEALGKQAYSWVAGKFELKSFLEELSLWARTNLTHDQVMKLSKMVEQHLVFSGTFGAIAESFDGTLIDGIFEKGFDILFPASQPMP